MVHNSIPLQDAPYAVALLDHDLKITAFSRVMAHAFNFDESVRGKSFLDLRDLLPEEIYQDLQLAREGIPGKSEPVKFLHPDGEADWYQWKINPHQSPEKGPGMIMLILEKVTHRMLGEDLHQKAQRMARVGSWALDIKKNTLFWSAITKEIHQVPQDFEPDLETSIHFYKEGFSRDTITRLVAQGIENGTPWDVELIVVTQKGHEIWVRALGEPEMAQGKCVRISGTLQDIDARKRIELENNKISKRLEIATKAAQVGIWDFDIVNNVLEWDDNMYRIYGVPKEKFVHVYEAWEATIHPEDKDWSVKYVQQTLKKGDRLKMDFRILWHGKEIRWLHGEATLIRDAEGKPLRMIGTNWDITAQKQAETEMQELLNTTTYQNESLLNFAHIVSHNMRSHGSNLSMLTDFLLEGKIDEEERMNALRMLKKAATGLNDTIAHLNEVVQIKTEAEQKMVSLNLLAVVQKVHQSLEALFASNEVGVTISVPEHCEVMGVMAYVESAVLNLMTNAVKYRDPEKEASIHIRTESRAKRVVLHIEDNGLGIDMKKNGEKIFGMYKTFHHHPESRGIGLFITRNQIESMGGTIVVLSEPGKGSTFSITLKKPETSHE
jgi:PAS domain S-box-containing protein